MRQKVTFKGSPLSLVGRVIKEGGKAPDFKAVNAALKEITLSDFKDKIKVSNCNWREILIYHHHHDVMDKL